MCFILKEVKDTPGKLTLGDCEDFSHEGNFSNISP